MYNAKIPLIIDGGLSMKIKTVLLKLVTAIIDLFVLFFGFTLTMGTISSIKEGSIFGLQILTASSLFLGCLIILGISYYLFRIFLLIDQRTFFSKIALHAVKMIRYLFIAEFVILLGIMPFVYYTADHGDAPGLIIIVGAVVFLPLAIATFVYTMEQILDNSIKMKDENDLTI